MAKLILKFTWAPNVHFSLWCHVWMRGESDLLKNYCNSQSFNCLKCNIYDCLKLQKESGRWTEWKNKRFLKDLLTVFVYDCKKKNLDHQIVDKK